MLVREHDLKPDDVTRIDAWTHKRRLEHTNRPDPRGPLDAKFSVQYCVARALVHGDVSFEHFDGDAWCDTATRDVLKRVMARTHDYTPRGMDELDSRVRDGRVQVRYQYFRQLVPTKEVVA